MTLRKPRIIEKIPSMDPRSKNTIYLSSQKNLEKIQTLSGIPNADHSKRIHLRNDSIPEFISSGRVQLLHLERYQFSMCISKKNLEHAVVYSQNREFLLWEVQNRASQMTLVDGEENKVTLGRQNGNEALGRLEAIHGVWLQRNCSLSCRVPIGRPCGRHLKFVGPPLQYDELAWLSHTKLHVPPIENFMYRIVCCNRSSPFGRGMISLAYLS